MNYTIILTISVSVESSLSVDEAKSELAQETQYSVPSTDNVKVIKTEIIEVE